MLVTSRQGASSLWDGMMPGQQLVLSPLKEEHAVVLLLRWKLRFLAQEIEDQEIWEELFEMRKKNVAEYKALLELAGGKNKSLGGLALSLAQAGSYINRFQCTFQKYLVLFKQA